MVDAINGNYGAKSQDLSINWNDLTATEVLAYEDEGQDVPDAILAWAQEMAGTENADQITYEMYEDDGENASGNAASDLRNDMNTGGTNLKDQGRTFIERSKESEALTLQSITEMVPLLSNAQAIGDEATAVGESVKTQLDVIQNQIQALIDENNDKPILLKNRSERGEIQGLRAVAEALGTSAQNQIQGLDAELNEVDAIVNEGAFNSQTSIDFGTETADIGNTLINAKQLLRDGVALNGGLSLFFGGKRIGREAVEQGTQTKTIGEQGLEVADASANAYGVSTNEVAQSENEVGSSPDNSQAGDTTAENEPAPADEGATATANSAVQEEEGSTEADIDPTLADTSITTDPDEILRRKERRGLA